MNIDISAENIVLNLPLYKPIKFNKDEVIELGTFLLNNTEIQFDCYCVECNKESTFKFFNRNPNANFNTSYMPEIYENALNSFVIPLQISFNCQRNNNHKYSFSFRICDFTITKVGQFPSIASIENQTIKKYQKILNKDYQSFSKAIGLSSIGIGAGSFVYLRRIFENLIEDNRKEAAQDPNFNNELFQKSKMDERIKLLKEYLPPILVENRKLYGILSKAIHELSEEECLSIFPDVKLAIELILDQKIYLLEQQKKVRSVQNFVSNKVAEFKS